MTRARLQDADVFGDLPVPPWVRPLTFDEQMALIREAQDSIARGEVYTEEEADRIIDGMIAECRAE